MVWPMMRYSQDYLLLEKGGSWHITPAFDLTFSCFNPHNQLDPYHYLSMNGKRTDIRYSDIITFARTSKIDNPDKIIRQCVEAVLDFRLHANRYGVSDYWQDVIERHFAEMNPDLLSSLHHYKPLVYEYVLEPDGILVKDAHWEEMSNGAKRLIATLNGEEYKATVSLRSAKGREVAEKGGIKMSLEEQRKYVIEFLLPRYRQTHP